MLKPSLGPLGPRRNSVIKGNKKLDKSLTLVLRQTLPATDLGFQIGLVGHKVPICWLELQNLQEFLKVLVLPGQSSVA